MPTKGNMKEKSLATNCWINASAAMGEDGKTGKPSSAFDSLLETSQGVEMKTQ